MKISSISLALVALLSSSVMAADPPPNEGARYIHTTYFRCTSKIEAADKAFDALIRLEIERLVQTGKLSTALYLSRDTGGPWVRAVSLSGPTVNGVLAAAATVTSFSDSKPPKLLYDEACGFGEDYVWRVLLESAQPTLGAVAFSTYYVCEQTREPEADAIMKRVIAPTLDKLVKDGKLKSWFWAEHIIGGKFQRLASMSASDRDTLLAARGELVEAIEHDPLANDLRAICGSHDDYIWDVKLTLPGKAP